MSDNAQVIIVKNAAHTGYRRAGYSFNQGNNRLNASDITDTQLAQLKADSRLAVFVETEKTDTGGDTQGTVGTGENTLTLIEAIQLLDPENPDHFTSGGKPQVDALSRLLNAPITAAERDAAWDELQANADKAE